MYDALSNRCLEEEALLFNRCLEEEPSLPEECGVKHPWGWHKDLEAVRMGGLFYVSGFSEKWGKHISTIISNFRLGTGLVRRLVKGDGQKVLISVND